MYTVPRPSTRLCRRHCHQPVTLIDVCTTSPSISSTGRLPFSFLNMCSLMNKVDDLLGLRRDRHVDVMCLAVMWHDTDSVALRRLCFNCPRPPSEMTSEMPTMSTNHGGVAAVSVSGVRLSSIALGVDPTSFDLLCARVVSGSFSAVVVLSYRPCPEDITTTFFFDLVETLDRVVASSVHRWRSLRASRWQ